MYVSGTSRTIYLWHYFQLILQLCTLVYVSNVLNILDLFKFTWIIELLRVVNVDNIDNISDHSQYFSRKKFFSPFFKSWSTKASLILFIVSKILKRRIILNRYESVWKIYKEFINLVYNSRIRFLKDNSSSIKE